MWEVQGFPPAPSIKLSPLSCNKVAVWVVFVAACARNDIAYIKFEKTFWLSLGKAIKRLTAGGVTRFVRPPDQDKKKGQMPSLPFSLLLGFKFKRCAHQL